MKRFFLILFLSIIFFLVEFLLFNFVSPWIVPNLLLLMIIYINLSFGMKEGLLAAVIAGMLKDSFGIQIFGVNISSFVICVFLVDFLKKYLFHGNSFLARILLVFMVCTSHFFILVFFNALFSKGNDWQSILTVLLPEVLATLLLTPYIFKLLKKCVSDFSV